MADEDSPANIAGLLKSIELPGGLALRNRIAMLPMTRARANADGTPNAMMAEYYHQRSGEVGLVISESTVVSEVGRGFINGPGMYTTEHAIGWRRIVEAVHARGAKIFLQINHVGRLNNLQHLRCPVAPLAPSPIAVPRGSRKITINIPRVTPYDKPRSIGTDEAPLIAAEFARATQLAVFAGFDGVEVHADSGYLIHQFLSTNVNRRTDRYGGTPQNRARFALEVLDAVIAVNGAEYVAIKLTPGNDVGDIEEDDIDEKYDYLVGELNKRNGLAFLHLYFADLASSKTFRRMRARFDGIILAEGSQIPADYEKMLADGLLDMTGFGRAYIANPDYMTRLVEGYPLSQAISESIYAPPCAVGYSDYPAFDPADPTGSVVGLDGPAYEEGLLEKQVNGA